MYSRPTWPPALFEDFRNLAERLGYKVKGEHGRWAFMRRLIAYANEHPELFRN